MYVIDCGLILFTKVLEIKLAVFLRKAVRRVHSQIIEQKIPSENMLSSLSVKEITN